MSSIGSHLRFSCDETRKQLQEAISSTEPELGSVAAVVLIVLSELDGIFKVKGEQRTALPDFLSGQHGFALLATKSLASS